MGNPSMRGPSLQPQEGERPWWKRWVEKVSGKRRNLFYGFNRPTSPKSRRASGTGAHGLIGEAGGQSSQDAGPGMQVKVIVHEAEEGGFWAEVPALPGCVSQGETMDELLANVREAIAAWLATEPPVETGAEVDERRKVVDLSL